ncbi:unnamed protein product [Lepeophtheirus salmonis]|uniref:(salmon louse) hypothetical protein n=1 Tax=Lepeophtheirus salmonis TaxID=72036 RepID=A0A7R8CXV6_LEPSM|nr:unnamed protein product [Lepeophtheirus salmonis]CAF2965574.1 unnamed protein product [Lepeophtheirus salmonis]
MREKEFIYMTRVLASDAKKDLRMEEVTRTKKLSCYDSGGPHLRRDSTERMKCYTWGRIWQVARNCWFFSKSVKRVWYIVQQLDTRDRETKSSCNENGRIPFGKICRGRWRNPFLDPPKDSPSKVGKKGVQKRQQRFNLDKEINILFTKDCEQKADCVTSSLQIVDNGTQETQVVLRVLLTKAEQKRVSCCLHEGMENSIESQSMRGHWRVMAMPNILRRKFYWRTMNSDIKEYCKFCNICQKVNELRQENPPIQNAPIPTSIFLILDGSSMTDNDSNFVYGNDEEKVSEFNEEDATKVMKMMINIKENVFDTS